MYNLILFPISGFGHTFRRLFVYFALQVILSTVESTAESIPWPKWSTTESRFREHPSQRMEDGCRPILQWKEGCCQYPACQVKLSLEPKVLLTKTYYWVWWVNSNIYSFQKIERIMSFPEETVNHHQPGTVHNFVL